MSNSLERIQPNLDKLISFDPVPLLDQMIEDLRQEAALHSDQAIEKRRLFTTAGASVEIESLEPTQTLYVVLEVLLIPGHPQPTLMKIATLAGKGTILSWYNRHTERGVGSMYKGGSFERPALSESLALRILNNVNPETTGLVGSDYPATPATWGDGWISYLEAVPDEMVSQYIAALVDRIKRF